MTAEKKQKLLFQVHPLRDETKVQQELSKDAALSHISKAAKMCDDV